MRNLIIYERTLVCVKCEFLVIPEFRQPLCTCVERERVKM